MLPAEEAELRQYLTKYQNPDIARKDILNVVKHYKALLVKEDTCVFNDGTPMDLVNLDGTIPVSFKGSIYNIPICIWLLKTHPNNSPLCYVKPTSDMSIQVSMFVDHNGRIYLPYLHEWKPNCSDLLGLIQVMISKFAEQSPVYAEPKHNSATPYPTTSYSYMPQPGIPPVMPPFYPPSTGFGAYQREQFSQSQAEFETLRRTNQELLQGKQRLDDILKRLEKEQSSKPLDSVTEQGGTFTKVVVKPIIIVDGSKTGNIIGDGNSGNTTKKS